MEKTFWTIQKTDNQRFPFRLKIACAQETYLDLLVQHNWPGPKGNVFCVRADGRENEEGNNEIAECVPVLSYALAGKRLTVILDRPNRKRCSFLFLSKKYKNKEGEYEQIFWQTQQGLIERKSKYKLSYNRSAYLTIFTDTAERYAWSFPAVQIVREKLPIGDYAIKDDHGFLAIVERKTFANLMNELGNLKKFHQHLRWILDKLKNEGVLISQKTGREITWSKVSA